MNKEIIKKEERKGMYTILILYLFSWGMLWTPYPAMRLVAWVSLGIIGFSLWRIIEGLIERSEEKKDE